MMLILEYYDTTDYYYYYFNFYIIIKNNQLTTVNDDIKSMIRAIKIILQIQKTKQDGICSTPNRIRRLDRLKR